MEPQRKSRSIVLDAIQKAYGEEYANVHRGLHFLSNTATDRFEAGAQICSTKFINAPNSTDEIIFTSNATAAINLVASSYGGVAFDEGDEIVLSIMEHHSNIVPWHFHRERKGVVLKWSPVSDDGDFLIEEFEKAFVRSHQAGGDHTHVECAGDGCADQAGHRPGPCQRHSGAGGWLAGGRPYAVLMCRTLMPIFM